MASVAYGRTLHGPAFVTDAFDAAASAPGAPNGVPGASAGEAAVPGAPVDPAGVPDGRADTPLDGSAEPGPEPLSAGPPTEPADGVGGVWPKVGSTGPEGWSAAASNGRVAGSPGAGVAAPGWVPGTSD
ncbi:MULTISPECIES: hypothetical protein [unclassified Nocardia]|uniref:hypothetical protein n=1 Tax=unclassified Nocardia TaxID=2637762 RepID=UPI0024A9E6DB|nr:MULTISPECIES: hypothetical protein [unclassified Nocardia]